MRENGERWRSTVENTEISVLEIKSRFFDPSGSPLGLAISEMPSDDRRRWFADVAQAVDATAARFRPPNDAADAYRFVGTALRAYLTVHPDERNADTLASVAKSASEVLVAYAVIPASSRDSDDEHDAEWLSDLKNAPDFAIVAWKDILGIEKTIVPNSVSVMAAFAHSCVPWSLPHESVRTFVRLYEDIALTPTRADRIMRLIERIAQTGVRVHNETNDLFGNAKSDGFASKKLQKWKRLCADDASCKAVLSMVEASFINGTNAWSFINELSHQPDERILAFCQDVAAAVERGVSPRFVWKQMREGRWLPGTFDPSVSGLGMFTAPGMRSEFLRNVAEDISVEPRLIPRLAPFLRDGFMFETPRPLGGMRVGGGFVGLSRLRVAEEGGRNRIVVADEGMRRVAHDAVFGAAYRLLERNDIDGLLLLQHHLPDGASAIADADKTFAEKCGNEDIDAYVRGFFKEFDVPRGEYDSRLLEALLEHPMIAAPAARVTLPATYRRVVEACYAHLSARDSMIHDTVVGFIPLIESALALRAHTGVTMPMSLARKKADRLLSRYAWLPQDDDRGAAEECGVEIGRLSEAAGELVVPTPEAANQLILKCLDQEGYIQQRIPTIARAANILLDEAFARAYVLNRPEFVAPLDIPVSDTLLDEHFSRPAYATTEEYGRIYRIFGCRSYMERVLERFEGDSSRSAVRAAVRLLGTMGHADMHDATRYADTRARLLRYAGVRQAGIRGEVASVLSWWSLFDLALSRELEEIVRNRGKAGVRADERVGPLGLTHLQEVALLALFEHSKTSATAVSALTTIAFAKDVPDRLRERIFYAVSKKWSYFEGRYPRTADWVRKQLMDHHAQRVVSELPFLISAESISHPLTRRVAMSAADQSFASFFFLIKPASQRWTETCPDIPREAFLLIFSFLGEYHDLLLSKINTVYKRTRSSSQREALLSAVAFAVATERSGGANPILPILASVRFTEMNAGDLATVILLGASLERFQKIRGETSVSDTIFSNNGFSSLSEVRIGLERALVERLGVIFQGQTFAPEQIVTLLERWGTIEPIIVYAAAISENYPSVLGYLGELIAHFDPPEYKKWRVRRYRTNDERGREQIGFLRPEQREIWMKNGLVELGTLDTVDVPADVPARVAAFVEGAVRDRHIYRADVCPDGKHAFIQERVGNAFAQADAHPDRRATLLASAIERLRGEGTQLDAILQAREIPRAEAAVATVNAGGIIPINAKTKQTIEFLARLLPKDVASQMNKAYKTAANEGKKSVESRTLFSEETSALAKKTIERWRRENEEARNGSLAEDVDLSEEDLDRPIAVVERRRALKAAQDLLGLATLDARSVAQNRFNGTVEKGGVTLLSTLDGLKAHFQDTPAILQDLSNIRTALEQRESVGDRRRLAMWWTDDPQALFQVGAYPVGSGSCQSYDGDASWNRSLPAYVGDANIRVAFLVDLNKLNDEQRARVDEVGLDAANVSPQALLESCVARSVVKLLKDEHGVPHVFIEPTYSAINKSDKTMNHLFERFVVREVCAPMGARAARYGGTLQLRAAASRNPEGQYEDAGGEGGDVGMGIMHGVYWVSAHTLEITGGE